MKKEFHFIVQAKGGVGKSLHTYLRALSQADSSSLFVDLDSSTKTSSRQLAFLGQDRFEAFSLLDNRERLMRDLFIGYVESLADSPFEKVFMDFGAPESEQLPALITRDIDLKEWCDELGIQAIFHIIIGGGGAYLASIQFLEKMRAALNSKFQIVIWQNLFGFNQFPGLSRELEDNCTALGLDLRRFGDFEPASLLGGQILDGIRNGYTLKDYPPGARLRLKRNLKRISAMNSPEPNRLTQTRGKYAAKYGHEIDDWSALFLSETQEHFQSLEIRVGKSIAAIDRAALELKGRKRHLQFQDRGQALFYGLGVSAPFSIAGIVVSVLFYVLIRHGQQYAERQRILEQYPDAPAYRLVMQHGKIIEQDGVLYLQLVPLPKRGEVQIGEHYLYDSQGKRVLVPLGNQ